MTFLPIVERELRVGARRRGIGWSRAAAAGLALAIFFLLYLLDVAGRHSFSSELGKIQFAVLSWLAFIFACGAGLFLTSDALSEEKREGTLGLLFLTDLRGYDVVLGKLIANSTRAFYALLAAFPVLALPLLEGGVAVGEFWLDVLVICNTLFLSISIGLFVSSLSRDSRRSMNGVLLALLLLLGIAPLVDLGIAGWGTRSFNPYASMLSPGYLFIHVDSMFTGVFWIHLTFQHALGWVCLALSCYFTPRTWQEKVKRRETAGGRAARSNSSAGTARIERSHDPLLWLARRERVFRRLVWGASAIALILLAWAVMNDRNISTLFLHGGLGAFAKNSAARTYGAAQTVSTILFQVFGRVLIPVLELWVAVQASRFFLDSVKNGALELILVAPVGPEQIVGAQWKALCRLFALPVLTAALYSIAAYGTMILDTYIGMAGASRPPAGAPTISYDVLIWQFVSLATGLVVFFGNLVALAWFGMWMGLTNRKPTIAVLKTVCFVVIVPKIGLLFIQGFLMAMFAFARIGASAIGGRTVGPSGLSWFYLSSIIVCFLTVVKDAVFVWFAHQRLTTRFREAVAWEGLSAAPPAQPIPPCTPPPPPLPSAWSAPTSPPAAPASPA
jgi:ABC-type transport system involved in cytochrome c biogenesis permease component